MDGAVVLTRNFDLIGFGAETLVKTVDSTDPEMCFIDYDNTETKRPSPCSPAGAYKALITILDKVYLHRLWITAHALSLTGLTGTSSLLFRSPSSVGPLPYMPAMSRLQWTDPRF